MQWGAILFASGLEFPVERFQEHGDIVKNLMWSVAQQILAAGGDVILDFSLWSQADRRDWKERVQTAGFATKLYFVQCNTEEMRRRLQARNDRVKRGEELHFLIDLDTFDSYVQFLEPPSITEDPTIIQGCPS